jgi:ribose 5-phosphate isomerase
MSAEQEKDRAAQVAAGLVDDGMCVGLGTGSTVAFQVVVAQGEQVEIREFPGEA